MEKNRSDNPHVGHRERVRSRFLKEGLDHFEDHTVLELLLFFGIPQKDTNVLAHRLIETFGSFNRVFAADYEQLRKVEGMTGPAATLIAMIPALCRRYISTCASQPELMNSSEKMGEYLVPQFIGRMKETVFALFLDNSCRLLRKELISEGGLTNSKVSVRKIVEYAIQCQAVNVVLAHNHPVGSARPSAQDIRLTNGLQKALKPIELELLDHIIVGEGKFTSMMEEGYLGIKNVDDQII